MYKRWSYSDIVKANEAAFEAASFITQEVRKEKEKMTHEEIYKAFMTRLEILKNGSELALEKEERLAGREKLKGQLELISKTILITEDMQKAVPDYRDTLNATWKLLHNVRRTNLQEISGSRSPKTEFALKGAVDMCDKLIKVLKEFSQQLER